MAFDRQRSIPEPIDESDSEPADLSLFDIDWEDPDAVRALITEIDAKLEAKADPEHPHTRWLAEDRQHRINDWASAFFGIGVTPPDGWEAWVK